jgi:hypothetical protein
MAEFVHVATARAARRIERSGIAACSHGRAGDRGVYCMPVLPSFTLTYQWVRERPCPAALSLPGVPSTRRVRSG